MFSKEFCTSFKMLKTISIEEFQVCFETFDTLFCLNFVDIFSNIDSVSHLKMLNFKFSQEHFQFANVKYLACFRTWENGEKVLFLPLNLKISQSVERKVLGKIRNIFWKTRNILEKFGLFWKNSEYFGKSLNFFGKIWNI